MNHFFKSWAQWLGDRSLAVLVAVLVIVLGIWMFVAVAGEVKEGDTQAFDDRVIRAMRQPGDPNTPIGPAWLPEVGRDITALGGIAVLSLVTAAVVGYLLITENRHAMWLVLVATGGGLLISNTLKHFYHRPRPQLVAHLAAVYTSSFPSGHSMLSAVVYLTLGTLLARLAEGRAEKFYFIAIALVLTFLVGVSRIYMGVHYPTDVLAGWAAGLTWALLCWLGARYLQRRGAVEQKIGQR